jgi:hypothetical protein
MYVRGYESCACHVHVQSDPEPNAIPVRLPTKLPAAFLEVHVEPASDVVEILPPSPTTPPDNERELKVSTEKPSSTKYTPTKSGYLQIVSE